MAYSRLNETSGNITWDGESPYTRLDETSGDITFYVAPVVPDPVNTINQHQINEVVLNGSKSIAAGYGNLLTLEQSVGLQASGSYIEFEQEVDLLISGQGSLFSFEQKVNTTGSGSYIELEQRVVNPSLESHFYEVNGFEVLVTIGNKLIDADNLIDGIDITFNESDSASAIIHYWFDPGTYSLYDFQGKTVTIDIRRSGGTTRVFSGWVDLPIVNVLKERVELQCLSDRRDLLRDKVSASKKHIGRYSDAISGVGDDPVDEIEERLLSIPYSIDFDGNNNWTLNSWTPKSTADYTLGNSTIFRRDPQVTIEKRNQIINKINLEFRYNYVRSYHATASFVWIHPYRNAGICNFLREFPDIPTKEMIESAIDSAGWQITNDNVSYTSLFPTGDYNCSFTTIIWDTVITDNQISQKFDVNGNPVTDTQGNPVYSIIPIATTDLNDIYAMGAAWTSSTRFNQSITERYNITLQSTKSQLIYGVQEQAESFGYTDPDTADGWEVYEKYDNSSYSGAVQTPGKTAYYLDNRTNKNSYQIAIQTAIARAKTRILKSHRDSKMIFQRDLWENVNLKHTVELSSTKWMQGKGKVTRYKHHIDVNGADHYTEVELTSFRSVASETDTPITTPSAPTESLYSPSFAVALDSHYGLEPHPSWTGHIGNKWINERINVYTNSKRTTYQEQFRVDTPQIGTTYRNARILDKNVSLTINIPQDNFSVIAYGLNV